MSHVLCEVLRDEVLVVPIARRHDLRWRALVQHVGRSVDQRRRKVVIGAQEPADGDVGRIDVCRKADSVLDVEGLYKGVQPTLA